MAIETATEMARARRMSATIVETVANVAMERIATANVVKVAKVSMAGTVMVVVGRSATAVPVTKAVWAQAK